MIKLLKKLCLNSKYYNSILSDKLLKSNKLFLSLITNFYILYHLKKYEKLHYNNSKLYFFSSQFFYFGNYI